MLICLNSIINGAYWSYNRATQVFGAPQKAELHHVAGDFGRKASCASIIQPWSHGDWDRPWETQVYMYVYIYNIIYIYKHIIIIIHI